MRTLFTRLLLIASLWFLAVQSSAQTGIWTWMHGSSTSSSNGNYGTKGVAAASNEPPCRYQACYWTDLNGNFWLFGGVMTNGEGNDLWKYDVTTNMWTWISGPNVVSSPNPAGVPGTKGVPSVNNCPAGRGFGANCWTDSAGDLWLYGGSGAYNDLWRYHIATSEWTWVNGNQTTTPSVYGTMGVASSANTPGDIQEVKSAWVDAANNLWMFGGQASTTNSVLWKYNIPTDQWTWVLGSTTTSAGNYGTFRVEAATNEPPSRWSYTRWKDGAGNLYLFAGSGSTSGELSDVWRYRPSTNEWTWVAGPNTGGDTGKYPPTMCQFYDNYYPRCRYENQTAFSNNGCSKAFWTFGGFSTVHGSGILNDLWLFAIDSFKWSWVSGSPLLNQAGNYGTLGTRNASNMPGGKAGQCMWIDKLNNLWVFGGYGAPNFGLTNDLWRFEPDNSCIPSSLFSNSQVKKPDTMLCLGDKSTMTIGGHQFVHYSPASYVSHNTDSSELVFTATSTTSYQVIIGGGGCGGLDTEQFTIHVLPRDTVRLAAPHPSALCVGDSSRMSVNPLWTISISPDSAVNYQVTGGSQIVFYPATTTSYIVTASDADRCAISPDSVKFTLTNDDFTHHLAAMTDTILCKGDTAIYIAVTNLKYWSVTPRSYQRVLPDSQTFLFYPPVNTTYRFIGIQQTGCLPHDTLNFTLHRSRLKAAFTLSPQETDLTEPNFNLTNNSIAATGQNWYQNGSFFSAQVNATLQATDTGNYCFMLVASDELSCKDTAFDCGRIVDPHIYMPSAFSPNGDGKNDIFRAISKDLSYAELAVYDRYGERVFISYDKNVGWDGNYGGKPCDLGVYFYYLKYRILNRTPVYLKGDVTLIR